MSGHRLLFGVLLALAATFAAWFGRGEHALAGLLVFALPPLLLAVAAWRRWSRVNFVAGVCALLWFSHGVMTAWAEPGQRAFAWIELLLALAVVYATSIDGYRARRANRR
jgi:uncharacterized membrane protein